MKIQSEDLKNIADYLGGIQNILVDIRDRKCPHCKRK